MPAFGSNSVTCAFARRVLYEPNRGFRLSDRIVSAIDRFVGALTRFKHPTAYMDQGVMNRWLFIYPFVGGTDWTHALNLADVDGNFGQVPGVAPNIFGKSLQWSGSVTHNQFGVTLAAGAVGNTGLDAADWHTYYWAWNRKSHGVYSRTNVAVNVRDVTAEFVEPRNGARYWQGLHLRWGDGLYYGDLCVYVPSSGPFGGDRAQVAVSDSLGLFSDSQRGNEYPGGPFHYTYKRGVYICGDNSAETGMGYGDVGSGAWLYLNGGSGRTYSFFFSTKHPQPLEGTVNTDGTGGQLPGSNQEFNYFVEQLQVALQRNV